MNLHDVLDNVSARAGPSWWVRTPNSGGTARDDIAGLVARSARHSAVIVAFPVVHKGLADVGRIPGPVWRITGYANRKAWRVRMIVGYASGGWPRRSSS